MSKSNAYQPRQLLTFENAKTTKGEALGYRTGILYLAPASESGVVNTCPAATEACRADCLYTAGRGAFQQIKNARVSKTLYYALERESFERDLTANIKKLRAQATALSMRPAVRINGTSDLPGLARKMARQFTDVTFYDYTKLPRPWTRETSNYRLTFSYSGENWADCVAALEHGVNVAVVFDTKKGKELPATWRGYKVIDGDEHDLRFLDERTVIVGLRAKGAAKKDAASGFVVSSS